MRTILAHISPRSLEMTKRYANTITECIIRIDTVQTLVRANEMGPQVGVNVAITQSAIIKEALDEINRYLKLDEIKN